jgi:hypothetical protein
MGVLQAGAVAKAKSEAARARAGIAALFLIVGLLSLL